MKIIFTILVVLFIEAVAWTAYVWSGGYNVSMSNHDNAVINWYFDKGTTRSLKQHASGIKVPPLDKLEMLQTGAAHFQEMCAQCHGAPGKEPDEIAKGLWPKAPDLGKAAPHWSAAQLFWITKHGIKFSAMPAWGPTHSDDKIWDIIAFLRKLPNLSPTEYQQLQANAPPEQEGSGE